MTTLITNIKKLVQVREEGVKRLKGAEMSELPSIENAFLLIEDGRIKNFGVMPLAPQRADKIIDAKGKLLFPAWCDSHTHLVFAGSREGEFVDRINGLSYEEIARRGGGILNSANKLQGTSESELLEQALARLEEIRSMGTGAVEIKSGYGLTVESEIKILRTVRRLKDLSNMDIKATFLGAHSIPLAYKENRSAYVDLVINEMLPQIAAEGLADYIDVFCEKVAFSVAETERIIQAGAGYGLKAKVHTNQFNSMGGIQMCVANNALSVDHLEVLNEEEIECLSKADTMPTLLPSAPFFINDHYPPARKMLQAGLGVALATDYNPGSTPSGNMPFVLSLACIKMRMTPAEAINAATLNGAYAMELSDELGSITIGKKANLFLTKKISSENFLPYAFGSQLIDKVFIEGKEV